MHQHCQSCVMEVWDSADQAPEPRILRYLNQGLSIAGLLPLYPKLGHVYEDGWNFAKLEPCGLLS